MRAAMIDAETRAVVNVIVADPLRDKAPDGFELAAVPDGMSVGEGWLYSVERGFLMGPELKERVAAEEARQAAEMSAAECEANRCQ